MVGGFSCRGSTYQTFSSVEVTRQLDFRVELSDVAEFILPRDHQLIDRYRLKFGQVRLQFGAQKPRARLMIGMRATRWLLNNVINASQSGNLSG